jgi:hypothetical protein
MFLNDVVLNQLLVHFQSDDITRDVITRVQAEGTCWAGGATWQNSHAHLGVELSTMEFDIDRSAGAILRCCRQSRPMAR